MHERRGGQKLPVGPVENIEEAVAIPLQQEFPLAAAIRRIHQHERFGRIPIDAESCG